MGNIFVDLSWRKQYCGVFTYTENGVTIIPVSKISMGFASGGLDYDKEKNDKASIKFGGGGGTGLHISPVAFLVVRADGFVDIINVNSKLPADPVEQIADLIERSPDILAKIKAIFSSDKAKDEKKNNG